MITSLPRQDTAQPCFVYRQQTTTSPTRSDKDPTAIEEFLFDLQPVPEEEEKKKVSTINHKGAVWGCGRQPEAWLLGEKVGGAAPSLTSVGVSLLCPERTGSEGELALHGGLGFAFLPQQFTPVQLWSFGEWGQLVFALW